ncbi:hypothetical protein D5H75_30775 [Bailinhaonella thermotolerans]|uniref:Ricin B lectin domain-containing protein n=1 Tax=Bailinhaonella thermotolerans TaxID=1070861 RepID=A0A3A4ACE8_9ACTN|nr:hypothetical protein D5H75_30775 [Bailinhaonella thermotolerans]
MLVAAAGLGVLATTVVTTPSSAAPAKAGHGPYYYIIAGHSGRSLMAETRWTPDGPGVLQAGGNDASHHWRVLNWGHAVVLVNRHTGLCATVPLGDDRRVRQERCDTGVLIRERATWRVESPRALWAGRYQHFRSYYNGDCMDVYGKSRRKFKIVQHFPCHGDWNQRFRLVRVPGT